MGMKPTCLPEAHPHTVEAVAMGRWTNVSAEVGCCMDAIICLSAAVVVEALDCFAASTVAAVSRTFAQEVLSPSRPEGTASL